MPSVANLNFIPIQRFSTLSEVQHANFNILSTPVFTQLDDLKSHFAYVSIFFQDNSSEYVTAHVEKHLRGKIWCSELTTDSLVKPLQESHEDIN